MTNKLAGVEGVHWTPPTFVGFMTLGNTECSQTFPKVAAFCQLFFAKEQRKVLKGKPDGNLQVDFFAEC